MNRAADGVASGSEADPGVLAALTDSEKAELLDALIAQDATLAARAGREARSRLAPVDIADIANAVAAQLLGLDQEALAARWTDEIRVVEPTEAAWPLLEAALQPWLDDIARRAGLGFDGAARQIGLGVLAGLRQADDGGGNDERLLSWAPDFT